jgi:choline dehydrogenase-like flavoprotein
MSKANTPVATFDAIVIGTGQAGPPLARRLAAAGMTVAVIERGAFCGTCVNANPSDGLGTASYTARRPAASITRIDEAPHPSPLPANGEREKPAQREGGGGSRRRESAGAVEPAVSAHRSEKSPTEKARRSPSRNDDRVEAETATVAVDCEYQHQHQ